MEPESKQLCACCGNAAASKCSRCKAAVYCNAACQQANWREHKKTCNHLNLDRTVQHAGALVQKLFFIWRENTLDEEFDDIEENEMCIYFRVEQNAPGTFRKFPGHLVCSEVTKNMVLSTSMCAEYVAYFSDILAKMLKGLPFAVHEIEVELKEPSKMSVMVVDPSNKGLGDFAGGGTSMLLTLSLTSFIPCLEAHDYMSTFGSRVKVIAPHGLVRDLLDEWCAIPGLGTIWSERREGIKAMKLGLDKWSEGTGIGLADLLGRSDEEYEHLEEDLLATVVKMMARFAAAYDQTAQMEQLMISILPFRRDADKMFWDAHEKYSRIADPFCV